MNDLEASRPTSSLDELLSKVRNLKRYDMDSCPYYGDPCMEQAKDGDYFYVDDVIGEIERFIAAEKERRGNG